MSENPQIPPVNWGRPHAKANRNQEIYRLRTEGKLTRREIGQRFGISSGRVRQIESHYGRKLTAAARTAELVRRNREALVMAALRRALAEEVESLNARHRLETTIRRATETVAAKARETRGNHP